ncbi:MBOAT family protein [Flavobacterium columnare]|uniref:Membrane bound O-acyl transferase, MBOAT family protein n=2 Tax=Flavobacterium columnare TaxID=996 RepID=G8XB06_FLACA|nr:MBOAT family O-acyltransferase [Flavobacterium columnare]AEW85278.1 membrane bound O-acyl transferase, MBOAT family protein [Flavobacterium columnare ATCC 49512]AMO19637.1 MBOAT family protein [Flavobacterium columnare]MBF6655320.1 MBOAT family protein [Flavobacterium columnare]MBF6657830.1 MBOAT family protein [Flavobacterium columnare]OOB83980.1 membrane-bound O-acyltransferase family protein [Flavobacterium columnare]
MFFNSLEFAIFLPLVFLLYWFVFNRSKKAQNTLLIIASYYFYACWDWHFLFLLIFSTLLDYVSGIKIERSNNERIAQFWFWLSVGINLGFLGIFKYYNFFAQSFADLCNKIGFEVHPYLLQLVLPVGISFYTFHGLSYVIDIYKKRIKAEYNFIDYSLFVSYFPLLVAGPIERATHLLPQVKVKREFNFEKAKEGTYQIIWGLVKKIVVADSCALYANAIFDHSHTMNSYSLVLGAIYFAFQIYGDFSGYSDIALGTSKLFGIDLLKNFNYPYFSRDIAEFWRRWHISLSSWFRDYLYIPLGGSQGGKWMQVRNTFIIFLVSGFWHGANWTFIIWGLINAIYFLPLLLFNKNRTNLGTIHFQWNASGITTIFNIISTFALSTLAWIFFRAKSITDAYNYIYQLFTNGDFSIQYLNNERYSYELMPLVVSFILFEWFNKDKIEPISGRFVYVKLFISILALIALGVYSDYKEFIYFQF